MSASAMFKLKHVDEKGLGCFATTDIKTGTLIHSEYPQIPKGRVSRVMMRFQALL